ncbi:heterokaryon incompatibility protein-domain-containing protein [Xylariaceae sp. FL0804]|nr:heterokaryon incompatibility protein-domain-containing protein [Xylariaceae sp. FL0804]
MTTFKYTPIERDGEIRLLTLHPGLFDDDLEITLHHYILPSERSDNDVHRHLGPGDSSPSSSPPPPHRPSSSIDDDGAPPPPAPAYEALSYVWGSSAKSGRVHARAGAGAGAGPTTTLLDATTTIPIPVTPNLEQALRHLRRAPAAADDDSGCRTLWIDALCIDQDDVAERSAQVARMHLVYRRADVVMIWLGPAADDSDHASRLFEGAAARAAAAAAGDTDSSSSDTDSISSDTDSSSSGSRDRRTALPSPVAEPLVAGCPWRDGDADETDPDQDERIEFSLRDFSALTAFVCRPWFGRLWVLQEVRLARRAVLMCGRAATPWGDFAAYIVSLRGRPWTWQEGGEQVPPPRDLLKRCLASLYPIYRRIVGTEQPVTYASLARQLVGLRWTDPRDAVYAVRGLLTGADAALGVVPDYARPAADVYRDVAERLVLRGADLDFLLSCDLSRSRPWWRQRGQQGLIDGDGDGDGDGGLLNLPSWVPDWSVQSTRVVGLMADDDIDRARCAASGPLTPLASLQPAAAATGERDRDVLRVHAVRVATIRSVHGARRQTAIPAFEDLYANLQRLGLEDSLAALRPADPAEEATELPTYVDGRTGLLEAYCRALCCEQVVEQPAALRALRAALAGRVAGDPAGHRYLSLVALCLNGTVFFRTGGGGGGYCGLASEAAEAGDQVCVVLGCSCPLILREADAGGGGSRRWRVVGHSVVPGLMAGEAIVGPLPWYIKMYSRRQASVEVGPSYLMDTRTGEVVASVDLFLSRLARMGIHATPDPVSGKVTVPAETLRAKGVELETLDLI